MQISHSLSISRGLAKCASFRCVTSLELESISLLKWQSWLQMPWLVVVWTIVTLCLEVCPVSISTSIQNTLARIVTNHRKYAHVTPILQKLHWLPVKYRCIFKTATLVYKFLHSGSPSYFEPFLSFNSCPYSTRHSHPDRQYLTVPPFHSSVFKSGKHFGHTFAFDAPKIWNDLPQDARSATSVASFRKKLKTYLFAKAYPP